MRPTGAVAAGHEHTAQAAKHILEAGGNAFDAAVAAHFAACVAEPVLASLGGGGFLLARTAAGHSSLYDFFAHTPRTARPAGDLDFHPIAADFGDAQQEFHIGLGAVAVPGSVKGMFAIHKELCSLPMAMLMEPAITLAREGVVLNALQAYIFGIVAPIYTATPPACNVYCHPNTQRLTGEGDRLRQPRLAATLEALAREGEALFYQGELAQLIADTCRHGGHLTSEDLAAYQVIKRQPLSTSYRDTCLLTNPPPSSGGLLIAFALRLLETAQLDDCGYGSGLHLKLLAHVMALTSKARLDAGPDELLEPSYLATYQQEIAGRAQSLRGTTHISVMDGQGNVAALTLSNGEGCGHMLGDTGIMLNNMLGEEDLNPGGFHRWPRNQRMTSMMAPSLLLAAGGRQVVLGSGGSNRIRTALLQVLSNLLDFHMPLAEAVSAPRLHLEGEHLSIEGGLDGAAVEALINSYPDHQRWTGRNLFFGGVHAVMHDKDGFTGAGDPRRGGVALVIE